MMGWGQIPYSINFKSDMNVLNWQRIYILLMERMLMNAKQSNKETMKQ